MRYTLYELNGEDRIPRGDWESITEIVNTFSTLRATMEFWLNAYGISSVQKDLSDFDFTREATESLFNFMPKDEWIDKFLMYSNIYKLDLVDTIYEALETSDTYEFAIGNRTYLIEEI